jgi:dihydrofolate reductase
MLAEFVSSLIRENLIDEYHLFVNPAVLGQGMAIWSGLQEKRALSPVAVTAFDCGIVVMKYVKV